MFYKVALKDVLEYFYTVLFNSIVLESDVIPKKLKFSNHFMFNQLF